MTLHQLCLHQGQRALKKRCHKRFVIIMPVQSDVKRAWDSIVTLIGYLSCRFIIFRVSVYFLRAVIEGFTVRIVDKFNAEQILTMIKNERITHISLVPQTLNWLMQQGLHEPYNLQKYYSAVLNYLPL